MGGEGGASPAMRRAHLIARTVEHGHRAVCGGGLFEVLVDLRIMACIVMAYEVMA